MSGYDLSGGSAPPTPDDRVPSVVRAAVEAELGTTEGWDLLSSEHSHVWVTSAGDGRWSVKHLIDPSSDSHVERWVMDSLDSHHARRIRSITSLADGSHVVLAPFVEGELLSTRLERGDIGDVDAGRLASSLSGLLAEIQRIPLAEEGFGRLGGGRRPGAQSWTEALWLYLDNQRIKGPQASDALLGRLSHALSEVGRRLDDDVPRPFVHPTDVNARNFLIRHGDGQLVALNFPVIWQGDPAMPFGILQLHLDETPVASAILALGHWPAWRIHFYAMYHAYVICVYAERFSAQPLEKVTPWGRHRPLYQLFDQHHAAMWEAL